MVVVRVLLPAAVIALAAILLKLLLEPTLLVLHVADIAPQTFPEVKVEIAAAPEEVLSRFQGLLRLETVGEAGAVGHIAESNREAFGRAVDYMVRGSLDLSWGCFLQSPHIHPFCRP